MTIIERDRTTSTALRWLSAQRIRLAMWLAAGALAVLVCSTLLMTMRRDTTLPIVFGLWLVPVGIVLLWGALVLVRRPVAVSVSLAEDTERPDIRVRWAKRAVLVVALAGMLAQVELNAGLMLPVGTYPAPPALQVFGLVASCVLLIWGFADGAWRLPRWYGAAQRRETLTVAALTVFALALRLVNLEALRAFVDEGNFLVPFSRFVNEPAVPLLRPFGTFVAFPVLYPYLQWLASGVTDSGLVALRLPSAIFGALTIPALYWLGKQVFDRQTAFVAAGLLAAFPVHLQWSRFGMNNAADALFGVLAVTLLARGVRRGGVGVFAAAGVCLGLTQYFHEGGRLFFPALVGAWWLGALLFHARLPSPRQTLAVLVSAVTVALPVYTTLAAMDLSFTIRYAATRVDTMYSQMDFASLLPLLPSRLEETVLTFVNRPESMLYYGGDEPFLHLYLLLPLLCGLGVLVWRWRTAGGSLLILWIAGVLGAVSFLINGVNSARVLNVFPAMMMACALGITEMARLLLPQRTHAVRLVALVSLLGIGALHTIYYFGTHIDRFLQQHYVFQPEQEIAFHARDLPDGTRGFFLTSLPVRQSELDVFVRSYAPTLSLDIIECETTCAFPPDGNIPPQHIIYIADADTMVLGWLRDRYDLRGPWRWPNPYAPPGIEYVAYFVSTRLPR